MTLFCVSRSLRSLLLKNTDTWGFDKQILLLLLYTWESNVSRLKSLASFFFQTLNGIGCWHVLYIPAVIIKSPVLNKIHFHSCISLSHSAQHFAIMPYGVTLTYNTHSCYQNPLYILSNFGLEVFCLHINTFIK